MSDCVALQAAGPEQERGLPARALALLGRRIAAGRDTSWTPLGEFYVPADVSR
jgi:hypothetical protein